MKALVAADYVIVFNVINRFCTDMYIPTTAPLAHEYDVHFIGDPRVDGYGELINQCVNNPVLLPNFTGRGELSEDGPTENARNNDRILAALQDINPRRLRPPHPGNKEPRPSMGRSVPHLVPGERGMSPLREPTNEEMEAAFEDGWMGDEVSNDELGAACGHCEEEGHEDHASP